MSATSPVVFILPADIALEGLDRIEPCNKCATGQHIDLDHFLDPAPTYQAVDCPLCGKTAIRSRPRVTRIPTPSCHP